MPPLLELTPNVEHKVRGVEGIRLRRLSESTCKGSCLDGQNWEQNCWGGANGGIANHESSRQRTGCLASLCGSAETVGVQDARSLAGCGGAA
jgi:hypothetical protein